MTIGFLFLLVHEHNLLIDNGVEYVIDRCFEYLYLKHLQISMRSLTMKVLEIPMDAWSEVYKWFNKVYTDSSVLRIIFEFKSTSIDVD